MGPYVPSLDELLGDQNLFFEKYFNRSPLLRRTALHGKPREILSIADLDEILSSEAIRPPYLDIAKDGKQVPRAAYTEPVVVQGEYVIDRVVPARVAGIFRTGATLTWNSVNHYRANLRTLAGQLTNLFAAQAEAIAFLTPAGHRGLAPHCDPVDVFVVQLEGAKFWRVWPVPHQRRGDGLANLKEAELGEPAIEATLEPGDVLYIPYSCAHVATANDTVSLHLSVTVQPRRWTALLQEVVARLVAENSVFWGNPQLRDSAMPGQLMEMIDSLCAGLRAVDTAEEVGRLIADGIRRVQGIEITQHLQDVAVADSIEPDTLLTRQKLTTIDVIEQAEDKVRTTIDGAVYTLPTAVLEAVNGLAGGQTRRADSLLANASAELSTRTARTLVRIGVLRACRVPKLSSEL